LKILTYRPAPPGAGNTLCHVDVEIIQGVKLFGLRVAQMPDKTFRVFGPTTDRFGRSMSFDPATVDAIAHAAISFNTLDGNSNNETRTAS
jgi:hypothetical protein